MKSNNLYILSNLFTNEDLLNTLLNLGKSISDNFLSVNEAYRLLYKMYGNTIIFSIRSLKASRILYNKYRKLDFSMWSSISYIVLYQLINQKNSLEYDINVFKIIKEYKLNWKESIYYIRNHKIKAFKNEEDILLSEFKKIVIKQE